MSALRQLLPTNKSAALEHERLTSLINSMADGVIAIDEKQRIIIYNGAALNILDLNSSMTGKYLSRVLKIVNADNKPLDTHSLIASAKIPKTDRDHRLCYPDGSQINLYLSIAPVHLSYGKSGMRGHVILLRDITHEKSLEEERDEFINVVSHELRTPIAIAEGNISNAQLAISKHKGADLIQTALDQAHQQVVFLGALINDLSTLSRAESGKLSIEVEPLNVHDLIHNLAQSYTVEAHAKGLYIKTDIDAELELLHSSELYVHEILQNFITNALKYTKKGGVTLGAKPKLNGVEFFVGDTGIGISKSDQSKVFDKFFRSEDYRTRQSSGTGLGLYVTMKLARLIHADIDLDSELNKGSTFRIFIPNLKTSHHKSAEGEPATTT